MMFDPVCSTSALLPLPIVIAVPALLCTRPALMIVVLPLSVRMAERIPADDLAARENS